MAFDFKKEYREFYLPGGVPELITVPPVPYLAVRGTGDPNQPDGAYQKALGVLYAVAYTLRMSYKGSHPIAGFYDYVVPPLEGFWEQDGVSGFDPGRKADFRWISVIRLPDFVREADFRWAVGEAERKKKLDCAAAEFLNVEEGLCVQCMHIGPYDDEPATVERMTAFLETVGCVADFTPTRLHHEIYLSDARKVPPARRRTVLRHPVRRV